jgi:hypothetical protein
LKAKFEGGSLHHGFQRFIPGAFNTGFSRSTCTASPMSEPTVTTAMRKSKLKAKLESGSTSFGVKR